MITKEVGKLKLTTPSDREIEMTRVFQAPRQMVFDAHTRPELVRRWLGVFGKWTLPVCEIDLRVGGSFRYVWRDDQGNEMGMTAEILEMSPPERLVTREKFDQSWYEGDAVWTLVLTEKDGVTTLRYTGRYDSKEIRDAVLRSPMETGVAASYDQLERMLAG
jgi:uncharacterized protein YndB with AHSA1/START domain